MKMNKFRYTWGKVELVNPPDLNQWKFFIKGPVFFKIVLFLLKYFRNITIFFARTTVLMKKEPFNFYAKLDNNIHLNHQKLNALHKFIILI